MIYWYTGQPGHGKTLNGLKFAIEMKLAADAKHQKEPGKYPKRELFICNVRSFNYDVLKERFGIDAIALSPEEFKAWADSAEYLQRLSEINAEAQQYRGKEKTEWLKAAIADLEADPCATLFINQRYHNAIILVDEAYEHGIFPKRRPGSEVPRHVERMAKHRHWGIDLIGICQSPDTQCDSFIRDLIEEHVHVRRRFGTKFVHLRKFDKFNATPEKSTPLTISRTLLPAKFFGLYESTTLDTTEKKIPWYFFALPVMVAVAGFLLWYTYGSMGDRLRGDVPEPIQASKGAGSTEPSGDGRPAHIATVEEWANRFQPRVPSQPWSAPAYDDLAVSREAPRLFCMSSGSMKGPDWNADTCTCLTEQGTRYKLDLQTCALVSRHAQYEPYRDERDTRLVDAKDTQQRARDELRELGEHRGGAGPSANDERQVAAYGSMRGKEHASFTFTGGM